MSEKIILVRGDDTDFNYQVLLVLNFISTLNLEGYKARLTIENPTNVIKTYEIFNNTCEVNFDKTITSTLEVGEHRCTVKLLNSLNDITEEIDDSYTITYNADIYGKIYFVEFLVKHNVMYLTDITNHEYLRTLYYNRTEVLGYINIDNLEEALQEFDVQTKAEYEGKIIGAIAKWAKENGIFVRALTSTRYILITDQEHLERVIKCNFSILDDVKVLFNTSRVVRITLSMGIACSDINVNDLSEEAQEQLELALSRGGDQVVVKKGNEILYFGAKTDPIVKESKVEIRVKSEELSNLISFVFSFITYHLF